MAAGQYGSYKYESQEARALGSITVESYDKDQAKNLIKLNNDVTYMAAYMRKMQKGIDEANQNFIQQIQAFIADVIVLLGGGNAQGFDFGDLKYVLQMIGALLGFDVDGGIAGLLPLNAFDALWHMLSTYIFPSAQFADVINSLIDTAIAQILDIFGEIPVVGEALQQLAVIITEIRDGIGGLLDLINTILDALNLENADLATIGTWFSNLFGFLNFIDFTDPNFDPVAAVVQWITDMAGGIIGGADWQELLTELTGVGTGGLTGLGNFLKSRLNGQIDPSRLGAIPLTAIGNFAANLIDNPSFLDANAIANPGVFTYNAADGHTANGSAQVTADGTTKNLYSNYINVDPGQKFNIATWVKWIGLTLNSATPIRINVVEYMNNTWVATKQQGAVGTAGNSNNSGQNNFVNVANTYTVPAGVNRIVLQLNVTANATGGTIRFDDGLVSPTRLLQLGWVDGLLGYLSKLNPLGLFDASGLRNLIDMPEIPDGLLKIPNLQQLVDNAANALSGNSIVGDELNGVGLPTVKETMMTVFDTLAKLVRDVQDLQTSREVASNGGKSFTVNFGDFPNGPLPSVFSVSYTGPGTSTLIVKDGKAQWNLVNNGDRTAFTRYNSPTITDYQVVRGTMSSPPENNSAGQKPRIWALARMNAAGTSYVFARGYCTGFLTYRGDIGCVVNGVETVWQSNVPLTWSLDMRIVCGVGINPRRYQVLSGDTIVVDLIEPGTASMIGADYRYWGARADTNGVQTAGAISGAAVRDNAPPTIVGTTFRASRRQGADVTIGTGGAKVPNNFFETTDYISPDFTYTPGTNCRLTATNRGTYVVQYRVLHGQYAAGAFGHGLLYKNGVPYERGSWAGNQLNLGFSVNTTLEDATYASFIVSLEPGDYIEPGFYFTASMSNTGDAATMADGSQSWFGVSRLGVA